MPKTPTEKRLIKLTELFLSISLSVECVYDKVFHVNIHVNKHIKHQVWYNKSNKWFFVCILIVRLPVASCDREWQTLFRILKRSFAAVLLCNVHNLCFQLENFIEEMRTQWATQSKLTHSVALALKHYVVDGWHCYWLISCYHYIFKRSDTLNGLLELI